MTAKDMTVRAFWTLVFGLGLLLAGCGEPQSGAYFDSGWQIGGCAGQERALSEGAGQVEDCRPENLLPDEPDYCTEKLFWRYSAASGVLQLVDFPANLNCCGVRSVRIDFVDEVFVVTEIDSPAGEPPEGRCRCMCDTIYSICLLGSFEGPVSLRLLRDVTDDEMEPGLLWEGDLDPALGEGQIDLGPSNSWHCE